MADFIREKVRFLCLAPDKIEISYTFPNNLSQILKDNMTAIGVVIEKKTKKVFVGSDTLYVSGHTKVKNREHKCFKISNIIIGASGPARISDVLKHNIDSSVYSSLNKNFNHKYIVSTFIDVLRNALSKDTHLTDWQILLAAKNKAFIIWNGFHVQEVAEFDSIGSGTHTMSAVLSVTSKMKMGPKERLLLALKTTEKLNTTVGSPFLFFES